MAFLLPYPDEEIITRAIEFISEFEDGPQGPALLSYWDAIGKVWTIGTGLTHLNGRPIHPNQTITLEQNTAAVELEIDGIINSIRTVVHSPLLAGQWVAMIDFVYNIGPGCLILPGGKQSNVLSQLNAGHYSQASQAMLVWDHSHGVRISGLTYRREREQAMFNLGMWPVTTQLANVHSTPKSPIHTDTHIFVV